jgi:hypothetical protein
MKTTYIKQVVTERKAYCTPHITVFGHVAIVTTQNMMGVFPDGGTMMNMVQRTPTS